MYCLVYARPIILSSLIFATTKSLLKDMVYDHKTPKAEIWIQS